METVEEQFRTVKGRVEFLLENYPATRGNDSYLCWLYLKSFTDIKLPYVAFKKFFEFNLESITRARRKIQEGGRLLPDAETLEARRRKKHVWARTMKRFK